MSRKDQVQVALIKIGGKGTVPQICKAIPNLDKWGNTPGNTVSSILQRNVEFIRDRDDPKIWIYDTGFQASSKKVKNSSSKSNIQGGLYLITLSAQTASLVPGFAFKVGKAAEGIKKRLNIYNASLPFISIETLDSYIVDGDDKFLRRIEIHVRKKLLNNKLIGFQIRDCFNGNQKEWLIIPGTKLNTEEKYKLIKAVGNIVKETIDSFSN